jgi:hypothetical protein
LVARVGSTSALEVKNIMKNKNIFICLIAICLVSCASIAERQNNIISEYLAANSSVDPVIREAIINGKIINGMTAQQVFIASGEKARGYKSYSIWVAGADGTLQLPPYVIPPGTPTALIFKNTTQYNTAEPQYFVVYMDSNQKVLKIELGTANIREKQ